MKATLLKAGREIIGMNVNLITESQNLLKQSELYSQYHRVDNYMYHR